MRASRGGKEDPIYPQIITSKLCVVDRSDDEAKTYYSCVFLGPSFAFPEFLQYLHAANTAPISKASPRQERTSEKQLQSSQTFMNRGKCIRRCVPLSRPLSMYFSSLSLNSMSKKHYSGI